MTRINPDLLEVPKTNGMTRNTTPSFIVTLKNAIVSAFQNTVLRVQIENEKELQAGLARVIKLLEQSTNGQKDLQIGKASVNTDTIDQFRVANLEELKLENVESLAFAFEQLDPIIKSLQSSSQSDKQTIALLSKLIGQVTQLSNVLKESAKKTVNFPDVQKVEGSVQITNLPDNQSQIVQGLDRVEAVLTATLNKKAAKAETKIELAEGKMISEKLDRLAEALNKLPGNMEFPTTVQVTNFPPQKYPMPVTSININPLRGFAKSRNVTVTSTPTPLPSEILAYRRGLVVYNNSSTITMYVGGSDVSATNGMPVPPNSYSPAFDAGPKMVVYGVVSTGSIDVRTLELSNENIGG